MFTLRQTDDDTLTLSKVVFTGDNTSFQEAYHLVSNRRHGHVFGSITKQETDQSGETKTSPKCTSCATYDLLTHTDNRGIGMIRAMNRRLMTNVEKFSMIDEEGNVVVNGNNVLPALYRLLQTVGGSSKTFVKLKAGSVYGVWDTPICVSDTLQGLSIFYDEIKAKEEHIASCLKDTAGRFKGKAMFAMSSECPEWLLHLQQVESDPWYGTEPHTTGFVPTLISLKPAEEEGAHAFPLGMIAVQEEQVMGFGDAMSRSTLSHPGNHPPYTEFLLRTYEEMIRAAKQGLTEMTSS